jgi:hypothetical protein
MANRTRSKKRSKNKKSKKMYMQRGGVFTQEEEDILLNQGGFDQQQIDFLNQNNVSFQNIQTATNYVLDNNQHTIAVFIASCLHNNPNQNNQNEMPQDVNDDGEEEGEQELNEAFIGNNDALNNSDATDPEQDSYSFGDNNEDGEDGVEEDIDFDLGLNDEAPNNDEFQGGRRRKSRKTRKQRGGTEFSEEQLTELGRLGFNDQQKKILAREFSITPPNMAMESIRQALQHNYITGQPDTVESIMRMFPAPVNVEGGKRRKSRKSRKSKKQRGGMRYGTGVGSNCFEPNYSIYNTPALSLFPYKPN